MTFRGRIENGVMRVMVDLKILDMSAGARAVWFDKNYPGAVYVDIRPHVKPDIVADTRALPAEVGYWEG